MRTGPDISCEDIALHLESLRRGDASPDLTALADNHMARCPTCRKQMAHLKRLSRMFSAWRPSRAPAMVKIETAAMVSRELGEVAAQLLPQEKPGKRRRRPRFRRLPPLRSWQAAINWLAVAALIFAALAIVFQVSRARHLSGLQTDESPDPAIGQPADDNQAAEGAAAMFEVILISPGSNEAELLLVLRDITGLAPSSVRELLRQTPSAIGRRLTQAEAGEMASRLRAAGAEAEIRPQQP